MHDELLHSHPSVTQNGISATRKNTVTSNMNPDSTFNVSRIN